MSIPVANGPVSYTDQTYASGGGDDSNVVPVGKIACMSCDRDLGKVLASCFMGQSNIDKL